jgi:pyruvate,water dikinase
VFQGFLERHGLQSRLAATLTDLSLERIAPAAAAIRDLFIKLPVDPELQTLVVEAVNYLGDVPLAVRSSGVEEDSAAHSFAGQFDSFLGVRGAASVYDHVIRCWVSAFSERALAYRHRQGLGFDHIQIAVILQQLVVAEKSGVVFSANPVSRRADELMISSVYGLGEGLVSGLVDADTFVIDKQSGTVKAHVLGAKQVRVEVHGTVENDEALRDTLSLSADELTDIQRLAGRVEQAFGSPQDIEWCIAERRLWLVQSRPVTTDIDDGEINLWDNSNIIENYPGITSPLTFTFTQNLYASVFREYCRMVLIPNKYLVEMEGWLRAVLGYLNGRVYYNLLNWYRLVGVNPLQSMGRKMMELQMGVDTTLDQDAFARRIAPYKTGSNLEYFVIRLLAGIRFSWFFLRLKSGVAAFKQYFDKVYAEYNAIDYARLPADQVFAYCNRFERSIINRWGRMIALESSIGLSFGMLRMLSKRWLPDAPAWFETALIGGVASIESLEPARRIEELAGAVKASAELQSLFAGTASEKLLQALRLARQTDFIAAVDRYIDAYGYRSNNELKLEEPDLHEAPAVLFDMINARLASGHSESQAAAGEQVDELTRLLNTRLNGFQRFAFRRLRSKLHQAIEARETVRFCRSRTFGVFRRMFRAIACDFVRRGVLEAEADVFCLRLDELRGCFEGTISHRELGTLIAQRKRDLEAYRALPPLPPRFVTKGPVASWLARYNGLRAESSDHAAPSTGECLQGTPCAPGVVTGAAAVVSEPNEFRTGVLVTYRTDPGWVAVFPSAQALLVERGSPLTHAAIVARELGIPTIVQIRGLTQTIRTGMQVRVDGSRGTVAILEPDAALSPAA